jgi:crotonobetainyl-CoA:carnitine CoA-transferase CaiB-like acyl-CoA transferase
MLDGVKVVSFNHFMLGPLAAQNLGDLGADVIMIEPIGGAYQRNWGGGNTYVGGESVAFLVANRNKRSIALDLKSDRGREIALALVQGADVVMENFRPGIMDRLGLGWETARRLNPRLIFASASGWGSSGPYVARPGQDLLIQARSGLAMITGSGSMPPIAVGVSIADHHGAVVFSGAILAALVRQGRTGEGAWVEVDLMSAALDLQQEAMVAFLNGARDRDLRSPEHVAGWHYQAPYGLYRTSDGHLAISICALGELGTALDQPELAAMDEDDSWSRREEITALVQQATEGDSTDAWCERLEAHGIWHAPVQDYNDVAADPQVRHNGNLIEGRLASGEAVTLVAHAATYDGERPGLRLAPQPIGAQTAEILGELGYSAEAVTELESAGVIALRE